jgi:hypothetical protein
MTKEKKAELLKKCIKTRFLPRRLQNILQLLWLEGMSPTILHETPADILTGIILTADKGFPMRQVIREFWGRMENLFSL